MIVAERLIENARSKAGCADFGGEEFREPLHRMLASINAESRFTPLGAATVEGMLTNWLVNRLEVEDWYHRHPEIDEQEIVQPVFITGLPRTGSTALSHMLAADPGTRALRTWEAAQPCPPPEVATAATDPRIAAAAAQAKAMEAVAPGLIDALPRDPNGPEECFVLLNLSLAATAVNAFAHAPSFTRWTMDPEFDWGPAYRYHKRVLKLLQWRHPARRWMLKAPLHMVGIDALYEVYPDARFVMTHRDPVKAIPSVASLMHFMRAVLLEQPEPEALGAEMIEQWSEALRRMLAFRDRLGEARFFDNSHSRQSRDATGQIADLYAWLGWSFGDDMRHRLDAWREDNPKGRHHPDPAAFGLDPAVIARRFAFYSSRFSDRF